MKKFLVLITVATLTLCALCASAPAIEMPDFIGTWYLHIIEYDGAQMNPAEMGMDLTIMLNVDETATIMSFGERNKQAAWVIEGDTLAVYVGDEAQFVFTLVGKALVSDMDGEIMTFRREKPDETIFASAKTNASLEDFNGSWIAYLAVFEGEMLPPEELLFDFQLTISNGQVVMVDDIEEALLQGSVIKGVLTASGEFNGEVTDIQFTLLTNGNLRMLLWGGIPIYFQKAD